MDLPFSEKEIISIKRWYATADTFIRGSATETNAKRFMENADLLLFSCHSEYYPQSPLFSCLRLTPDSLNDGRLETREILGMNLNARLVTLSACQTALGKITTGDEVIGLTSAFMYAGAPSVISTLWRVDDLATAVTVKRFFRFLKTEPTAEALRDAQLFVKKYFPHPAYWASFRLSGL